MEERLDKLLIQRGLVSSRVRAEQIIRETGVRIDGKLITKTGKKFPIDCKIEMIAEEIPWVSRGALKLIAALEKWDLPVAKGIFLDIGASTGGFTEVLLNERVINLEKTHVRELSGKLIPEVVDGCVIDVSFISLEKIFPFIHSFLKPGAIVMVLVKPQFEVGKENIAKGGIVKNKSLYPEVIEKIIECGKLNNLEYKDHIPSPILGGDGNEEFLMLLGKNENKNI